MLNHAIQTDVRKRPLDVPMQKRILKALAALADENGEINRPLPDIARQAQACRRTAFTILHELEELGEILILSAPRKRGHYRINNLPTEAQPPVDSLRTPIVEAIRRLPLPARVSVIFQALAQYASRTGNNIFPSVKTLIRDTGYSTSTIQETLRWLLKAKLIAPDRDCVTPTYQTRIGYKIPSWNAIAQVLAVDEEQIVQIQALYDQHNRGYWERKAQAQGEGSQGEKGQGEDAESRWMEEHSVDLEDYVPGAWRGRPEEEGEGEDVSEELAEDVQRDAQDEETVAGVQDLQRDAQQEEQEELGEEETEGVPEDEGVGGPGPHEDRVTARHDRHEELQGEELGEIRTLLPWVRREMPTPMERIRVLLAPQRRNTAVSLRSYQTALAERESHRHIIEAHESGRALVDAATLKKSEQIVRFYARTIAAYEEQCERRE